jgi:hypothetical protein
MSHLLARVIPSTGTLSSRHIITLLALPPVNLTLPAS